MECGVRVVPEAAKTGAIPGRWEDIKSHFGFGSCALVGNAGRILAEEHGKQIDEHQVRER